MAEKLKISEVIAEARRVASDKVPTLYVLGGWGQKLDYWTKQTFIRYYAFNARDYRKAKILGASPDTIAMDCLCGIKSIWDHLVGVNNQTAAMRHPVPDITAQAILAGYCKKVKVLTIDEPAPGDFLVYKDYSHCGLYLGNGEVFEVTYAWSDGAQITTLEQRKWQWYYAGTPNFYEEEQPAPQPTPVSTVYAVQVMANRDLALAKKYLKAGQHIYKVGGWYKNAYTYASAAEAQAALPSVRKTYKDAFTTTYKSDQIIE